MIRGIVIAVTEGFIKLFSASGRTDESFEQREYIQHYGFTSRPLPGAEIIIIKEGNHIIAIGSDDRRCRLAIEEGEVALYTDEGDKIHLMRDKTVHIVSGNKLIADIANEVEINTKIAKITATTSCEVTSPEVTVNADTSCKVNCPLILLANQVTTRFLADERMVAAHNAHSHEHGIVPTVQLQVANVCTEKTKAG